MKKFLVMMAILLLFSSCGRESDYTVQLLAKTETVSTVEREGIFVIINKNSLTFHLDATCRYLARMQEENRMEMKVKDIDTLLSHGYKPCSGCAEQYKHDMHPDDT